MTQQQNQQGIHLAIIPDGNRRWAREHMLESVWKGHEKAVENFETLSEWCRNDPRVSVMTVWCFSTENWKRDKKEVDELMKLLEMYIRREQKNFEKKNTRLVHSGRRDRIPASLKTLIEECEEQTKDYDGLTLHLAVDYGGKDEIMRAIKKLTATRQPLPADLSDETLCQYLDHPELPDIDLILRSSGEQRTSNFFLWQSTYAEWVFSPKYFPDIGTDDLESALQEFNKRTRRFGGS